MNKRELGKKGESIAENYLRNRGYKIIERNFRTKYAEIDIVAKKDDTLIFIEVRSKSGGNFGTPEETINKEKKWRLRQNAAGYINFKRYEGQYRIDVICVIFSKNESYEVERMNHYQNIFL